MDETYSVSCDCGAVEMHLTGSPRVRGHCHCNACRVLLDTPYHSVTAWNPEQVEVTAGSEALTTFQHPELAMKKVFCRHCGEVVYNTNKMDWRIVSQHLLRKRLHGLPEALLPLSHFHYASRVVDVADGLEKKD
ncbi:GFA family protein (plasmid) [Falsihalocynthiibacter sp. SS001]|uniref:GFA family protein n=1 Tax=Falsihalocynthiibacter sp. SS001 TaxID=3349698 RepID=UPI0036D2B77F